MQRDFHELVRKTNLRKLKGDQTKTTFLNPAFDKQFSKSPLCVEVNIIGTETIT
jgi:hypothetical protein